MKGKIFRDMAAVVIAIAMAPSALQASDAFWHGVNIEDSGMDVKDMVAIHDAIKSALIALDDGSPTGFPTGDMIEDGDRGLRIYKPNKAWKGYTFLSAFIPTGPGKANGNNVLIDMHGNIVNEWRFGPELGLGFATAAKMLPGGHVVGTDAAAKEMNGVLIQVDWNGDRIQEWPDTEVHHDHQREGSPCGYYAPGQTPLTYYGKVLTLEQYDHMNGNICCEIYNEKKVTSDYIREFTWNGIELFRWDIEDYFKDNMLGLDEWAKKGIQQGLSYAGPSEQAPVLPEDWSHGNAVAWLGPNKWWSKYHDVRFHPDNIIAGFRSLNITLIIARHDMGGYNQGDIVWRLGPDYSTAGEDYQVGQIIGQHMAHMIPMNLPGAGNLLIFDNGGASGYGALIKGLRDADGKPLGTWPNTYRLFSRVLEINPMTKQIEWEYKQPNPSKDLNGDGFIRGNERRFFSSLMSGAQRLPNGNTLITEADVGRIFEVTMSGEVVWEYAPDWFDTTEEFMGEAVYRAYRIPYWWVPKHHGGTK
jgi:hypothetical protein